MLFSITKDLFAIKKINYYNMENNAKDKKELKYPIPEILEEVLEGVAQITGKISYVDIFNTRLSKYSINKLMKYLRKLEIMSDEGGGDDEEVENIYNKMADVINKEKIDN